jgi:hypothetical protein
MRSGKMMSDQKQIRQNIRNFLISATPSELQKERDISLQLNDKFRADCLQEMIDHWYDRDNEQTKEVLRELDEENGNGLDSN